MPMTDRPQDPASDPSSPSSPSAAAAIGVKPDPAPDKTDVLPPYRVLLHNDDVNDQVYVVETICDLTTIEPPHATRIMSEAHHTGVALLLTTHRERAELYVEQFKSKRLTVTIELAQ